MSVAANECGSCRFFQKERDRGFDSIGRCKLGKHMGVFASSMVGCDRFARPGDDRLPQMSTRRSTRRVQRPSVPEYVPKLSEHELRELMGGDEMSKSGIAAILAVREREGSALLGAIDAVVTLSPRDPTLQAKEIPSDQFSNKLFMMHGNLRVLEQKILTNDLIAVDTKFDLVERICRTKSVLLAIGKPVRSGDEQTQRASTLIREIEWDGLLNQKPSLGERWRQGQVDYPDSTSETIEEFFHRICVARDALMVLETMVEDVFGANRTEVQNLLAYVRRCYGTLKTFNILFANKAYYFTT